VGVSVVTAVGAAYGGGVTERFGYETPPGEKLRAFGAVGTAVKEFESHGGTAWLMRFDTAGRAKASTLAGKFLNDLQESDGVRRQEIKLDGKSAQALVTAGGQAFLLTVSGGRVEIHGAESLKALTAYAAARQVDLADAVSEADFPGFLSRWGWGFYGLGGLNDYHGWMTKADGKKTQKDPMEDLEFIQKQKLHFEPWLNDIPFDNSDGILANTGIRWMVKEAEKRQIPFSFRVYTNAGGANWSGRRFADLMDQPADFLQSGWHGSKQYFKAQPHLSWYRPEAHRYLAQKTKAMMERYQDSQTNGWMHPHGELVHDSWYDVHSDYSQAAAQNWRDHLIKNGFTLAELSAVYQRGDRPFTSYEQVPIPEFATFNGLPGRIKSLAGTWYYRLENSGVKKGTAEFWAKTAEQRYAGLRDEWYRQPLDSANWTPLDMPGNDKFYGIAPDKNRHEQTTWFRRSFTFEPKSAANKPVYLYFYPISHNSVHSGDHARYHTFFVNGRKAGEVGIWGALDVTSLLKAGENQVAFQLHGGVWNGRIFLSTATPRNYPYLGKTANRLWLAWMDWRVQAKYAAWRDILDAMRQADPEKPIKFMAPIRFGGPTWRKLAHNYGGWAHFTGEGQWFFPWYKRYSELYGLPASSELAGPCKNVGDQFNGYRRTFLAGLDGHEPVFLAQTYTRDPELRQWWEDHNTIIRRMGKYNIDGPQILLYRSTACTQDGGWQPYPKLGKASRLIQSPWNWDFGRGTLQTLGQSYLYLDDDGIADGKLVGYKLVIDCGNETMSPESVAGLADWVKAGGTYVALPFSGRNTNLEPDSWPIQTLTGCQVVGERAVPTGKATGTVTILKNNPIFKALAGQTFPDQGRSRDYIGNNLNNLSFVLQPGRDCQVLGTYEDGSAALVSRKLGKGRVITLGSAFFRDSQDRMGIWWPETIETDFFADLLEGIDYDKALCTTDDRLVWAQPYRSNNGLESVTTLISWHEDQDVTTQIALRLERKPARIVSYGVDGVQTLPFTWRDGVAKLAVPMPAREVKLICAETYSPLSAVQHWWNRQQRLWHALVPSMIDFTPYTQGRWVDPTQDLSDDARFTNQAPDKDWAEVDFDDGAWTKTPLDILNFWGAKPNAKAWVRKTFTIPQSWADAGGEIRLISAAWTGPHYQTPTRMLLNGQQLHGFTKNRYNEFEISRLLRDGNNTLAFEIQAGEQYVGFAGSIYLYHRTSPLKRLAITGSWQGTDRQGRQVSLNIPGKGRLKSPTRRLVIPAEWKGKGRVRLHMTGDNQSVLGAFINNQLVRRHHHRFGGICDIDITNAIRYGEENEFILASPADVNGLNLDPAHQQAWQIESITLELHPNPEQ
jgi:hypothetical protein